ncbi:serine acetyltransferase [Methylophilus sp. 14]|uniref:serine O-acetyltransferase n=1 Tax=Methylophilus sp. 14 TaxID=2781019 RepID=UPI00188E4036|nr:serine acetyltransferase [Methylophilus sp. 14]
MKDLFFEEDLNRYPPRPFLKEQSIWAIKLYRWGRQIDSQSNGIIKPLQLSLYWFLFRAIETLTGISLPKGANVGPGLRIWHFGNIFINSGAIIGKNCTLRQGVTIGNRHEDGALPVIGDNVDIGAYAQILGGVRIGNNVKIGAMSVVLEDIPANSTAVGIPAKVIKTN